MMKLTSLLLLFWALTSQASHDKDQKENALNIEYPQEGDIDLLRSKIRLMAPDAEIPDELNESEIGTLYTMLAWNNERSEELSNFRAAALDSLGHVILIGGGYYLTKSIALGEGLSNGLYELFSIICLDGICPEGLSPTTEVGGLWQAIPNCASKGVNGLCRWSMELFSWVPTTILIGGGIMATAMLAPPAWKYFVGSKASEEMLGLSTRFTVPELEELQAKLRPCPTLYESFTAVLNKLKLLNLRSQS